MTHPLTPDHLYEIAQPEQPVLEPGGRRVAYVLRTVDRDEDRYARSLWMVGTDGGSPRPQTSGPHDTSPAWSPDGTCLAFLRGGDGPAQVWLLRLDGGEPSRLTELPYGAGAPVWSPDGTRLAFAAPVPTHEPPDPAAPVVADRLTYKIDGVGAVGSLRRHLHLVDVAGGGTRQITRGDWDATPPSWSPDGTRLAFSAAMEDDSDLTLRSGTYTVAVDGDHPFPRLAGLDGGMAGPPVWTRDGSALIVIGRQDVAAGHMHLLKVPLDGSGVVNLSESLDRNVMPGGAGYPGATPQPTEDGAHVLFCARDRGYTRLYAAGLDSGGIRCVVDTGVVSGLAVSGDLAATVHTTDTSYGEVATVDLASGSLSTHTAHGRPVGVDLLVPTEHTFTLSDGTAIHGWMLTDPAVGAGAPRPMLLDIHGGPHNAWNGASNPVHLYHQVLARRGWLVLLLNPRGSDGYGEEFYRGAVGAWGQADEYDFLEPVSQLVEEGLADPDRLAVTGYSYGGFMTCWLTSRTGIFSAAVAGGVVTDLTSLAGTSDMGWYTAALELGAAPWEDPHRYDELSPISRVGKVRTPTLILQGGEDLRCPTGQAEQWFTSLRAQKVPAQLVLYPGASHLFILNGRPSHRVDWNNRIIDWLTTYTGGPRVIEHSRDGFIKSAEHHGVPGAVLGILSMRDDPAPDDIQILTHGVMNTLTEAPVTADTLFQLGSITKVWTATLAMQLVDEGLLDLDTPVVKYLPDFRLADDDVAQRVTMRHLLNHTSGIDGDVLTDTGRGDDAVERFVADLYSVSQVHPLGAMFSYGNSGYVIAGRIIEVLTGRSWDEELRSRLLDPLGLADTVTLPEDAIVRRVAGSHVRGPDGEPVPATTWSPPRSLGPAAAITSTVSDLLTFARMHLAGGLSRSGTRVLSEQSAALIAGSEVPCPTGGADFWGLGWAWYRWGVAMALGHDGATAGQSAYLRALPERGIAIALLTNGGDAAGLWSDVLSEFAEGLEGVTLPDPVLPSADAAVNPDDAVGIYGSSGLRVEVGKSEDGLVLREELTGPLSDLLQKELVLTALPVRQGLYAYRKTGGSVWFPVAFLRTENGTRYMHAQGRAKPEVGGSDASA